MDKFILILDGHKAGGLIGYSCLFTAASVIAAYGSFAWIRLRIKGVFGYPETPWE